jgi:protein-L-isoaspartate(D-aspartate) O-methyltransferase
MSVRSAAGTAPGPRLGRWARAAFFLVAAAGAHLGGDALRSVGPGSVAAQETAQEQRRRMVGEQLAREAPYRKAIRDSAVLRAMGRVPRHEFVPPRLREVAYADRPLPIGHGQTISQPWIVARMTELVRPRPGDTVLEVGTGSGYQAAVLAEIVGHVYTVEIIGDLARPARRRLERLGYENVTVRHGDGYRGWAEHAPFDAVVVTAAPKEVPVPLVEQLARGGRMVVPVGPQGRGQDLTVLHKRRDGSVERRAVSAVRFVPLTRDTTGGRR